MEVATKLAILADAAKYDASCASSGTTKRNSRTSGGIGSTTGSGICHSYTPDGRCVSLLKILLTNYCIYDCLYCINRISSDVQRARFTPDEVVQLTLDFYRRNYIEGLFLSSGSSQSGLHDGAGGRGRAHAAHRAQVPRLHSSQDNPGSGAGADRRSGRWADRISINIELPTEIALEQLAPQKSFKNTEAAMSGIRDQIAGSKAERRENRKAPVFAPAGQSTQMIVGATDTPDATILAQAASLYRKQKLRRVYYSAFSPIPDASSKLPLIAPPLVREHRLYQADWLVGSTGSRARADDSRRSESRPDDRSEACWALRNRQLFSRRP
jgi:putative DNA modification/repair radical SAM protein